jgi:phosphoserine phosphatase
VLAEYCGVGKQVSEYTSKAMNGALPVLLSLFVFGLILLLLGSVKFEDSLAARLGMMKPSKSLIEQCLKDHPFHLSPGIEELVRVVASFSRPN